ncbi:sporulation protein [Lysinibacillus piscis]|uniref:Sporulation-control protein n=1 Tax=Lysinibacillus piscis TaxID=2518931 RepID=A0ABQ5NKL0_9BACI|nr:sporulation protein [Lysinibacillus sp. KH24]GLC88829.1 sporulation-control protein [Lysinibacillus sp. KH24]
MSFFNKALASIGIGAATVDTKLERDTYRAGDVMRGEIIVRGGHTAQQIDAIYVSLHTTYIRESGDRKHTEVATLQKMKVTDPFSIAAGEHKAFPIALTLPLDTPITIGKTQVWLQTGLDIKNAVDPTDKDFIRIQPTDLATHVLNTIQGLGFRLREAECEHAPAKLRGAYPFIQEFEYVPTGQYRGHLDELEITFLSQSTSSVDILMQVDRKVRGIGSFFAEALNMDESHVRTTITTQDLPTIQTKLQQLITKHL